VLIELNAVAFELFHEGGFRESEPRVALYACITAKHRRCVALSTAPSCLGFRHPTITWPGRRFRRRFSGSADAPLFAGTSTLGSRRSDVNADDREQAPTSPPALQRHSQPPAADSPCSPATPSASALRKSPTRGPSSPSDAWRSAPPQTSTL